MTFHSRISLALKRQVTNQHTTHLQLTRTRDKCENGNKNERAAAAIANANFVLYPSRTNTIRCDGSPTCSLAVGKLVGAENWIEIY